MSTTFIILLFGSYLFSTYAMIQSPSILIIGAGPSGIAAATKLWKSNFRNLTIVEAENRIGGRIYSKKFGDAIIDLGGEWCHGEEGNIVYNMINQYNILKPSSTQFKIYYSNGTLLDLDFYNKMDEFSESIHLAFNDTDTESRCGRNFSSVGECFDSVYNSTFMQLYQNNPDLQTISIEAKEWLESYILSADSPFSLHDLSLISSYKISKGNQALSWDGKGYKTILELMLQQFPDPSQELPVVNNFILKEKVTKLIWSNDIDQVKVLCLGNKTYTADHVIFTPSLGVLKANHERLFEPTLPEDKVRAINKIGFGAIMKVIMIFPNTWWDTTGPHAFIWSAEDRKNILTEFGKGPVKNGRSWLMMHTAFLTAEQNPKVLINFFAGDMIPELEQESDEVIIAGCMYMFRKFLGATYKNISDPVEMIKTTWYSNPHFRGTYSYDSATNTEQGLHDKLAAPLTKENGYPRVMFAGEATHPYYFSTVHGAIESGHREAGRLIDYYANLKDFFYIDDKII